MQAMPTQNSRPELALRSELHRRGLRFRLHVRSLPGSPDIVLPSVRVAVFVDGCFWHGCPVHHRRPMRNGDWWQAKIVGNRRRDARVARQLRAMGWSVVRVWEHEQVWRAASRIQTIRRKRQPLSTTTDNVPASG